MKRVIRYFYKGALVSEDLLHDNGILEGWANNNPPYQPENYDRWEVKEIEPPYKLYHPSIEREIIF